MRPVIINGCVLSTKKIKSYTRILGVQKFLDYIPAPCTAPLTIRKMRVFVYNHITMSWRGDCGPETNTMELWFGSGAKTGSHHMRTLLISSESTIWQTFLILKKMMGCLIRPEREMQWEIIYKCIQRWWSGVHGSLLEGNFLAVKNLSFDYHGFLDLKGKHKYRLNYLFTRRIYKFAFWSFVFLFQVSSCVITGISVGINDKALSDIYLHIFG